MSNKRHITPRDIASLLEGGKKAGNGYILKCPAHEDKTASLKVSPGHKGTVMFCHAGCSTPAVLAKLGLRREQLFYDYNPDGGEDRSEILAMMRKLEAEHAPPSIEDDRIRFDDIMWRALVNDKLPDDMWGEVMALTGIEWGWICKLDYEEAMSYSVIVRSGPLFTFLRPLWEVLGRPSWTKLADVAMDKMHTTYVEARA
jgi:hypothetical protein